MEILENKVEIYKGEGLKTAAELCLQSLANTLIGDWALERYAFGPDGRINDPSLKSDITGIPFENPVLFGAGWDKKGRAIHGLYHLGFSGGEIGTVLPFGQYGNPKPRLWTIDNHHSVGLNNLGFNSPGQEEVGRYLGQAEPLPCPIGINVARNKIMPNEMASWAHEEVIKRLGKHASYITLGISSPNSPGLRGLQDKGLFREVVRSAKEAINSPKPLFAKIDSERTKQELNDLIEIGLEEGLSGFVATNSYMGGDLKAKYGSRWANEAGGLSGADPDFRNRSTSTVRHIYEEAGDKLVILGVGGVDSAETALEKMRAGASAVQVVTAIRPSRGRIAASINLGLLKYIEHDGMENVQDYVGLETNRGALKTNGSC